jgi:inorganic pyrophosphatase
MKTIITAGARGADIDVLGCAIAYAELLRLEGYEAVPVIQGSFTSSVTPSLLALGAVYETGYTPSGSESFVLVDISDHDYFPAFVARDRISEVYDHRHGFEEYWNEHLGINAHIEMVGSCGTLIWEQFQKRGKTKDISTTAATLLLASIVSNNLAFKSPLTTQRDRSAYTDLIAITGLSDDWIADYFHEQEKLLLDDFDQYVRADTKIIKTPEGDYAIGQIEMWDAGDLLSTKKSDLTRIMGELAVPWIVNILNISKGFNYVYSESQRGRELFTAKLKIPFDGDVAKTDALLMRKYLMKVLKD